MAAHVMSSSGIGRLAGQRSRQLSRAGMLLYALGTLLGAAGQAGIDVDLLPIVALLSSQAFEWTAFIAFVISFVLWFRRAPAAGMVAVDAQTVRVTRGGLSLELPVADVDSAFVVVHEGALPPTVELLLRNGDALSCNAPDVPSAHALVSALGFGPGRRRVRIPFATPQRRLLHPLLGLLTTWVGGVIATVMMMAVMIRATDGAHFDLATSLRAVAGGIISMLAIFVVYPLLKRIARAPELTIGDDGIVYTAGRKTRFIPREQIRGVEQPHPRMATTIRSEGAPIIIFGTGIDADRRSAATWLLSERLQAPAQVNATRFARAGNTIGEWREHLRRAMDPGYRAAGTSETEAEATLRSPGATPDEKVGAAIALRVAGAEPARIRIAAEGMARDPLRDAISAIADDASDEVLEQKLARLRAPR